MNTGPTQTAASSTLPMHIARAYQLAPRQEPSRDATAAPELSAGQVGGRVSFDAAQGLAPVGTQSAASSFSMYTNPAHRNAAATGVQLGRLLDAEG